MDRCFLVRKREINLSSLFWGDRYLRIRFRSIENRTKIHRVFFFNAFRWSLLTLIDRNSNNLWGIKILIRIVISIISIEIVSWNVKLIYPVRSFDKFDVLRISFWLIRSKHVILQSLKLNVQSRFYRPFPIIFYHWINTGWYRFRTIIIK